MIKTILILIGAAVVIYWVMSTLGVLPRYQCGSTMGPNGPVQWCQWQWGKGDIVG